MSREWKGSWWLPGQPQAAVGGELILSSDEFSLLLDGELPYEPAPLPKSGVITELLLPKREPIILGRSRDGEKLTLAGCEGSVPVIPATRRTSRWRPEAVFVGELVPSEADLTFRSLECEFDHLLDWAGPVGIARSFTFDRANRPLRVDIGAEQSVIAKGSVRGSKLKLLARPSWSVSERRAEVEMHARLRVELAGPLEYRAALEEWFQPLADLVSLSTVRPARAIGVHLLVANGSDSSTWVELIMNWVDLDVPRDSGRRLIPQDMLFRASDLPGGFGRGIAGWLRLRKKLSAAIGPLLGVDHLPFVPGPQRFLAQAQAAEVYHRLVVGGTPFTKRAHKARVRAASDGIADVAIKAWAKRVLGESNQLRLADRVGALVDVAGELGDQIAVPDRDTFVRRVVKTRNHLTHLGDDGEHVLENPARYWHGQALAWLVRISILGNLGFSQEDVLARVQRNLPFGGFLDRMRESVPAAE